MDKIYKLTAEEAIKKMETTEDGLKPSEAVERLKKYGANKLGEKKHKSSLQIFMSQFANILIIVLLAATAISFILGEILDGIVIIIIVIINALVGYLQEKKAESAIDALKKMASPKAIVIRNGEHMEVDVENLVPGDIIQLEVGRHIPADARLVNCMNLEVDESSLTGESKPSAKAVHKIEKDVVIGDMKNMVFSGTIVTAGHGRAVVVATGMNTEIGKIAKLIQMPEEKKTILQRRLDVLGKQLSIIIVVACVVIFVLGFFRGQPLIEMFFIAIALAVAAIPEGLPAVVTMVLAIGVQKMAKENAIIRKLSAVETLGSTTVICTDKTGTLTVNQMTVKKIFVNDKLLDVTGEGYSPAGKVMLEGKEYKPDNELNLMILNSVLCNDAELEQNKGKYAIYGDPLEGSLLTLAAKVNNVKYIDETRKKHQRADEIGFDSNRKCMSTIHNIDGKRMLLIKGAPEVLLKKSSKISKNGKIVQLSEKEKIEIHEINNRLTSEALRTLSFGYKMLIEEHPKERFEHDIIFLGIVGVIDPARPEAAASVEKAKRAGIKVVMVTGDHKNTAIAIAKSIGIYEHGKKIITGEELDKLTTDQFAKAVDDIVIYARVSPEHKLKIVNVLKSRNHVVAMTGDGVNDAPALKKADIGISMGIGGTDVAKGVSDMILVDDDFSTIVNAVEEGRGIYDNIKKTIQFLLACNAGEVITIFTAIMIGLPTPLLPIQILWMNLVSDSLPAFALGVDTKDPDIMRRKPRPKKEGIVTRKSLYIIVLTAMLMCVGTVGIFVYGLDKWGYVRASTVAFTTMIFVQKGVVLSMRSEDKPIHKIGYLTNQMLLVSIGITAALQMMILYIPFFNDVFKTVPLGLEEWIIIISYCIAVYIFLEMYKHLIHGKKTQK